MPHRLVTSSVTAHSKSIQWTKNESVNNISVFLSIIALILCDLDCLNLSRLKLKSNKQACTMYMMDAGTAEQFRDHRHLQLLDCSMSTSNRHEECMLFAADFLPSISILAMPRQFKHRPERSKDRKLLKEHHVQRNSFSYQFLR